VIVKEDGKWGECFRMCEKKERHDPFEKGECRCKNHLSVPIDPTYRRPKKKTLKISPENDSWKSSIFKAPTRTDEEKESFCNSTYLNNSDLF
jgi:hypothetical protein